MSFAGQGRSIGLLIGGIFTGLFGTMALVAGYIVSSPPAEATGMVLLAATVGMFVWFFYEYAIRYAFEMFLGVFIHAWDGNNFTAYVAPDEIHELQALEKMDELEELYKPRPDGRKLHWFLIRHQFEFEGYAIVASVLDLMALSRFRKGWVAIRGFLRRTKVADIAAVEVWHDMTMYEPELSYLERLRVALRLIPAPERYDYEYVPYLYVNDSDFNAREVRNRFHGLEVAFRDVEAFQKALPIIRKEAQAVWATAYKEKIQVLEQHADDLRDVVAGKDRPELLDKAPEIQGETPRIRVDWKKWAKRTAVLLMLLLGAYGVYELLLYLGVA